MNQAPAARVYNIMELAREIHEYCDIGVVANIASCNHSSRSDMQSLIQKRIFAGLQSSFGTSDTQDAFFHVLNTCNGVIYGSFALALFEPGARTPWTPNNLNVAVPWCKSEKMCDFLTNEGYKLERGRHVMYRWYHLIRDKKKFTKDGRPDILLCEGYDDTTLPIILASETTATINCLTSRTYYSFYPALTRRRFAFPGWQGAFPDAPIKNASRGYRYFSRPPLEANGECGIACQVNPRRVRGRNGIGAVVWNEDVEESKRLDEESFVWQLGSECRNRHCQYRTRRDLGLSEPSLIIVL